MSIPSRFRFRSVATLLLFAALSIGRLDSAGGQESRLAPVDFDREIKPLLSDRCFRCHGPDAGTREADLRLDLEEDARAAIVAGKPEESELYVRITATDDDQMPPQDSKLALSKVEIDLLRRWIAEGAKWEQHWAFVAPQEHSPPVTNRPTWPRNEIDAFVLSRLENEGIDPALFPSPPASKEKLLRRVSFDLTGLPPTLAELDAFLADDSPLAFEKAVDRLLASSRYGERMASDWLDLARYSDTYGYQVDFDRFVWPWRDWVIRAFNRNMPYDQFITEQLAGDLLPDATDDQVLATTFNRLHPQKVEGGSVEEEFRVEYVADRSQTVGMAFMGLTVECARCHDHKYDPISQKEYYQLFAFFNNIDESGLYSYFDSSAIPTPTLLLCDDAKKKELAELRGAISDLEQQLVNYRDSAQGEFANWLNDAGQKQASVKSEIAGLTLAADFEKTNRAGNELVDGPSGLKALKLTGDDEVRLDAGKFQRNQPFTIAARIKVPDNSQLLERSVILHRSRAWTDSASRGYELLVKNGRLSASLIHFWPGDAISVETQKPVATDKWIHVAMVYDGSSSATGIKIFVDGSPANVEIVRDNLQKTIMGSGTSHLVLGARFRDVGFKNGQIADLRVFDRELSGLELAELNEATSLASALEKSSDQLTASEREALFEYFLRTQDTGYADRLAALSDARLKLNQSIDRLPGIMVMREMAQPRPAFVLRRGAYDAPADPVVAGTPAIFPPLLTEDSGNRPANRLTLSPLACVRQTSADRSRCRQPLLATAVWQWTGPNPRGLWLTRRTSDASEVARYVGGRLSAKRLGSETAAEENGHVQHVSTINRHLQNNVAA